MVRFVLGFVCGAVIAAAGAVSWACFGFDVSARGGRWYDGILDTVSSRSVQRSAPKIPDPLAGNPAALRAGLADYGEQCVHCHGAPDVKPDDFADGLQPNAPRLWSKDTQSMSDGELFWVVDNGIRMTAMPAFGKDRSKDDIWRLVAAIRALPTLTPDQKTILQQGPSTERQNTGGRD